MNRQKLELARADFELACKERQKNRPCTNDMCEECELKVAIECIDKALSQPEIVRCAECKYFTNLNDDEFALCDRAFTGMYVDADGSGFCKWAERRTDERKEDRVD